jgi:hypothetical protein
MTTQTEPDSPKDSESKKAPFTQVLGSNRADALDWALFGCLAAGAVGIIKALDTNTPLGVLLCLLGSVAAFGLVIFVHLRK